MKVEDTAQRISKREQHSVEAKLANLRRRIQEGDNSEVEEQVKYSV